MKDTYFSDFNLLDGQSFDVLLGFSTQLLAGILTLMIGFWLAGRAGRLTIDSLNKIERLLLVLTRSEIRRQSATSVSVHDPTISQLEENAILIKGFKELLTKC